MRCSSANSPVGSHQCAESLEKWAISSGAMVLVVWEEEEGACGGGVGAELKKVRKGALATTRRAVRSAVRAGR